MCVCVKKNYKEENDRSPVGLVGPFFLLVHHNFYLHLASGRVLSAPLYIYTYIRVCVCVSAANSFCKKLC